MRRNLVVLLTVAAMFSSTPTAWAVDEGVELTTQESVETFSPACKRFYHSVTQQAQDIIQNKQKTVEEKQEELSVLFNRTVDTNWIGKFVLGRFWNGATAQEHKEYLALYRQYLTKIYVSKFNGDDLSDFELHLVSMNRMRSGGITTKTIIKRPAQQDVHVDYAMIEVGDECRVRDIVIENISLLSSQRSEFQALAGRSGIAGVIEAIKKQLS